jgi:hypothetical protein
MNTESALIKVLWTGKPGSLFILFCGILGFNFENANGKVVPNLVSTNIILLLSSSSRSRYKVHNTTEFIIGRYRKEEVVLNNAFISNFGVPFDFEDIQHLAINRGKSGSLL